MSEMCQHLNKEFLQLLKELEHSRPTVYFSACVQYALSMVREPCEVHAVLLALEFFCVLPFLAIVDL